MSIRVINPLCMLACVVLLAPRGGFADETSVPEGTSNVAIFAGGCFWCTESVFELVPGVDSVESGYIGGLAQHADYQTVCRFKKPIPGLPLHAEAVRIRFDPSEVSYEKLLKLFFKTHDPTSRYRQGPDSGPQYRTSVFFTNENQKRIAGQIIDQLNQDTYDGKIATELEDGTGTDETSTFYLAEAYHQDYFRKNPADAYCRINATPKMRKAKAEMKKMQREERSASSD